MRTNYLEAGQEPRWTRWLLLLLVPLGVLYLIGARGNSETFNASEEGLKSNDQFVYLSLAQDLRESGWTIFTPRFRTPGYPYVLSLFYSPVFTIEPEGKRRFSMDWFARARAVSIGLSMLCLTGLYFLFRRALPLVESALLVGSLACLLYVFRAGYTQPELLYWTLTLTLFALLMRMLLNPSWTLAVVSGVLAAGTYMVKSGVKPLLLLFVACFVLKLLWEKLGARKPAGEIRRQALMAALVPILFVACLLPYLINSTKVYGSPFYSKHSKYMMWVLPEVETDDKRYVDKHKIWALQQLASEDKPVSLEGYRAELKRLKEKHGEPYVEPDALPTSGRYLQRESVGDLVGRSQQGIRSTWNRLDKYYPSSWAFLKSVWWIALLFAVLGWRWTLQFLMRHGYVALYAAGFFVGYLILYGWYDALRIGPRLMLSLYPPALFTAFLVIHSAGRELTLATVWGDLCNLAGKLRLGGLTSWIGEKLRSLGALADVRPVRIANIVILVLLTIAAVNVFDDNDSDEPEERSELYRYFSGT